ncbi:response regulator transcription factor [Nocardia sp. NRRL WC-3656]|uniref:winged helix-turn-helix domain-containing protein n=1 Tax=Nocardia sp. NRRL WC-3656 TaxID=1463824 RepID=UPI000691005C|nr:response regulator transcription factor [Nocardia sp. NRRL WC-3656]
MTQHIDRSSATPPQVLRIQDVELDRAAHRIRVRGKVFALPPKEYDLLETLMLNAGTVLDREYLLEKLWGDSEHADPKNVDVHVLRLRRKIERNRSRPNHIRAVRGLGYVFDTEPTEPSTQSPGCDQ